MLAVFLFFVGFVFLIKGADFLVEGSSSIARRLNVTDLMIGLTVVAFGTSTPELFVNVSASMKGNTDIAIGNVLGSNISNIFLILGISSIIYPLSVTRGTVWKEIPFSLLAVFVLGITANDAMLNGAQASCLSRSDGLILLSFFIIFIYYSLGIAKKINGMEAHVPEKTITVYKSVIMVVSGLIGLALGGKWIVDGSVYISEMLGLSQTFIGLTIVAVGTSLPELATSVIAAYKRNVEIAVGNVVGSNIFNIFFVLGISSTVKPLPFKPGSNLDIGVVIAASLLLFVFMFTGAKKSLERWEGLLFVISYTVYILFLIIKG